MALCSAIKAVGKKEGGCLEFWLLSFQVTVTCDGALLSWRRLNTCLPMGDNKLIPYFALLVCVAFAFSINMSLSQPMGFFTSTLLIVSPIPSWGE